jgi:hypothetical protein
MRRHGLILFALLVALEVRAQAHLDTARAYIGVIETPRNSNRGPEVERFLGAVGLAGGYPYCAAFVSYCLSAAGVREPATRSARALAFVSIRSIRASVVQRGTVRIAPGTIVVWKAKPRPEDPAGHVGFVFSWDGYRGVTIEANTGPGDAGDQRDGGGVYMRKRALSPGSAFRIISFTPVSQSSASSRRRKSLSDP